MTADHSTPDRTQRHPIGVVSRRTGLKQDLIRAWERRYSAVEPGRSDTRRRFYSDADVERLLLLRRVVNTGRAIGQVAGLSNEALQALLDEEPAPPPSPRRGLPQPGLDETTESILQLCLAAAQRLDDRELELQIERASVALSRTNLLEKLLVPLMQRIGDLWHEGTLRPLHEHMASSVVRSFLGGMRGAFH
ncbi:MerR family transcriptional regulator, partial [bacterium]